MRCTRSTRPTSANRRAIRACLGLPLVSFAWIGTFRRIPTTQISHKLVNTCRSMRRPHASCRGVGRCEFRAQPPCSGSNSVYVGDLRRIWISFFVQKRKSGSQMPTHCLGVGISAQRARTRPDVISGTNRDQIGIQRAMVYTDPVPICKYAVVPKSASVALLVTGPFLEHEPRTPL